MIIRSSLQRFRRKNRTTKTLEASSLSNRSVRRTCGQQEAMESTLKECPICS